MGAILRARALLPADPFPRIEGWPGRMFSAIAAAQNTPFSWGVHDCCLFAADVALLIKGYDYAASFRGTYNSQESAAARITEAGAANLRALATLLIGAEITPLVARRGDVVYRSTSPLGALGICVGAQAVFAGPAGTTIVDMDSVEAAWRI